MGKAKGREFWQRLVGEVESGASQTEVAAWYGVAGSAVGTWVKRLAQERPKTTLVPVRVTGEVRRRIVVAVGSARVEFEEGTDPGYVASVVRAMVAC